MGKNHPGYIYFIRAQAAGMMKIGFSATHPDRRFRQLSSIGPVPLEAVGFFAGVRHEETKLHARFLPLRSHGEWFRESAELTAFVDSLGLDPWNPTRRAFVRSLPLGKSPEQSEAEWATSTVIEVDGQTRSIEGWAGMTNISVRAMRLHVANGGSMADLGARIARYLEASASSGLAKLRRKF